MGAPAISTRTRPARSASPATKPRRAPAKPRTAAKPRAVAKTRASAATKPRPNTRARATASAAAKPRAARTAAAPRARTRAVPSPGIRGLTPAATAVGRTAVAVVSLPDCGVVMGMTRSRAWIGVLGVLLGGIVALNVWGLSLTAAGSSTAAKIGEVQRENSVLRGRLATRLTNGRVELAAAELGLSVPAADEVKYLKAGDGDAARAAERISSGAIALVEAAAPTTTEPVLDPVVATDPLAPVEPAVPPVDPATTVVPETEPVVTDPVVTEPVAETPIETVTETTPPAVTEASTGAVAP